MSEAANPRILLELMLIIGVGVVLFWLIPSLVWVYEILSLSYLLIERRIRHRKLEDLGIKNQGIKADLKRNLPIIILVAVVIQFAVIIGSYWLWLPLFLRLEDRVAYLEEHFSSFAPSILFLIFIGAATLVEEIIFRGFVQERIGWFQNGFIGIVIGSLLMSIFHYSPGELSVVLVDLFFVFLDSSLYGLIYVRSRNVLVSWTAHLSADLVGLCLLWIL
ncbi:MAG: CPBP family intramembrane metalloprotease [Candidatus Bathyarchaeota archaeon]|nr:CPBP family intramembrane metalloprotease [Candidatus Bathyarchaeota archaeon]MDH5688063.1 CPBP family intramembrane metalloprotease [Candidatus Bathyarchaeota archaeon]